MSVIPQADFLGAGKRHCADADILAAQEPRRLDNADQLTGLGAECLLKALLIGLTRLPVSVLNQKDELKFRHHLHANHLWPQMMLYLGGHAAASFGGLLARDNPFTDFDVAQRYGLGGIDEADYEAHRYATLQVQRALDHAVLSGEVELW